MVLLRTQNRCISAVELPGLCVDGASPGGEDPGNGGIYNDFVVASFEKGTACVIFTNSGYGLRLCRDVVPVVLGGEHRVFDWPMVVT